jgi:hypothetical protein
MASTLIFSGTPLDLALGVRPGVGHHAPATVIAIAERDTLLREIATMFFPDLSVETRSREIAVAWRRYEAAGWARDRSADACPPRLRGRLGECLWRLQQVWPHPIRQRRLRDILG